MSELSDRYSRQQDVVPADRLSRCGCTVIGVGAVGRQVALQLAAMGAPFLRLVDFDTVEPANLAAQGYFEEDLGETKVAATARLCRKINSGIVVQETVERFRRSMEVCEAVFCCVDSISTRRHVWEAVNGQIECLIDGRMSAEVLRVLAACDAAGREHYPTTLFRQDEAHVGSCTAKTTIYSANIVAGLMVGAFAKWLRRMPVEADLTLNLLAGELTVGSE